MARITDNELPAGTSGLVDNNLHRVLAGNRESRTASTCRPAECIRPCA